MTSFYYQKKRLFTPGPTPLLSQDEEATYHRSAEFAQKFLTCTKKLKPLFGTKGQPLILTSSGTGAMEACLLYLTSPKDRIMVLEAGKFGERWNQMAKKFDLEVVLQQQPWGSSFTASQLREHFKKEKNIQAIFFQASETSTGAYHEVEEIAFEIKRYHPEVFVVVDAISSLGAHEMKMDAWHIDGVVSGSQKGFGVAPGLAFVALSESAWQHRSKHRCFYFDLMREKKGQAKGRSSWTPAITLIHQLERTLNYWEKQGLESLYQHHKKASHAVRAALKTMGLELFCSGHPSHALTSFKVPQALDGLALLEHLRYKYGAIFAGGQEQLQGKILRLAHLGFFDTLDIVAGVAALEMSLKDFGYVCDSGLPVLLEHLRTDLGKA